MFYQKNIEDMMHWLDPVLGKIVISQVLFILYKLKCLKDEEILVFHNS